MGVAGESCAGISVAHSLSFGELLRFRFTSTYPISSLVIVCPLQKKQMNDFRYMIYGVILKVHSASSIS